MKIVRKTNRSVKASKAIKANDYGYDLNGGVIDESTVEELWRIANSEILPESELATVCEGNCDIPDHQWNYYATGTAFGASTDYVINATVNQNNLNIYDYAKNDYDDIMLDFIHDDVNEFNINFEIAAHSGEVVRVRVLEVEVYQNGSYEEYYVGRFAKAFDLDAICEWLKGVAEPVVRDIQVAVSNI